MNTQQLENLSHHLIKYLRGQKSFPWKQVKKLAKQKTEVSTKGKVRRYTKGKFKKKSFQHKVFHLLEEIREYLIDFSKEEYRDMIAQSIVLVRTK